MDEFVGGTSTEHGVFICVLQTQFYVDILMDQENSF